MGQCPSTEIFCFVISKWHILVNSEVIELKYVIFWDILIDVPPNHNIGEDVSPSGLTPVSA